MHERTTAREIIEDFLGDHLDYWVVGYGTGGTLSGVSRVLAKESPATKIVVCEPSDDVDLRRVYRILPVTGADALRSGQELAAKEGIVVGITSGGTLAGALAVAKDAPKGSSILCMLPDTGERYPRVRPCSPTSPPT